VSQGNQFLVKRELRPEWYTNGLVKTFTKDEIEEWEKSHAADEMHTKLANQRGMTTEEIKYLDSLLQTQEEEVFSEIMQGPSEGE
jgi:hypothetical protein